MTIKQLKHLMLLVAMLIGGANMALAADYVNGLPESASYRAYWNWKCEEPTNYNKYRIANASKKTTNNLYTIKGNSGGTGLNTCVLAQADWITLTKDNVFSPKFYYKDGWGIVYDQVSSIDSYNNSYQLRSEVSTIQYGINSSNKFYASTAASNRGWDFYSEKQFECFDKLQAARTWAQQNFTQQEIDANPQLAADYNAFMTPTTPFTGQNAAARQKVDIAIAKLHYWYNTLHGYDANKVPYTMKWGVQGADGHDKVSKKNGYDCIEGWDVSPAHPSGETSSNYCWASTSLGEGYGGDANNPFYDLRNIKFTQTINNLPNGVYEFSVDWHAHRENSSYFNPRLKITAGSYQPTDYTFYPYPDAQRKEDRPYVNVTTGEVKVVDGTLTITIEGQTGGTSSIPTPGWINVDNFQLTYLYKFKEEMEGSAPTKTKKFTGVIDANDNARFTVDKDNQPWLNTEGAAVAGDGVTFNSTDNPNGICYAAAGANVGGDNVVKGGTCANLHLYDKYPYRNKTQFTATNTYYGMSSFGTGKDEDDHQVTYGTMMLPYDVSTITDVIVYKVEEGTAPNTIKFTQVTSIEANKPYLIKYTGTAATPLFPANNTGRTMTVDTGNNTYSNGLLVGAYQLTNVPKDNTCYLLQKQSGRIAFFRVASDGEKTLNVGPYRAYLKLPSTMSAPAKISIITDDEPTGIVTIGEEMQEDGDGMIYDISGRRVDNMNHRGFYIKNGKKILVK